MERNSRGQFIKGYSVSKIVKEKIRVGMKKYSAKHPPTFDEKCRKKISDSLKRAYKLGIRKNIPETIEKIRIGNLGKKRSKETREKIKEANRKGLIGMKGKKMPQSAKDKISLAHKGKKLSLAHRRKLSDAKKGDKSPLWRGGISLINKKIRKGVEWKIWRESVYKRDNWICYGCSYKRDLTPHHLISFAKYPKYRFKVWNGQTLCKDCHNNLHKELGYNNW